MNDRMVPATSATERTALLMDQPPPSENVETLRKAITDVSKMVQEKKQVSNAGFKESEDEVRQNTAWMVPSNETQIFEASTSNPSKETLRSKASKFNRRE